MSKRTPRVHSLPASHHTPQRVPDNNKNIRSTLPGGLPPKGIRPGWQTGLRPGVKLHTHS